MPEFSFIHAADLHLDSPFIGLGNLLEASPEIVEAIRKATFKSFDTLIDLCIQRQADFLLIAGDVYDGADRSLQAQLRFRDGLTKLDACGIQTFTVHGNHDPLDGWTHSLTLPGHVHTFGSTVASVVFQKDKVPVARIHGISYPHKNISDGFGKNFKRQGDEPFQIGLLHCNVGGNADHQPYAPRTIDELADADLDYWALGHVHESTVLRESSPFIGYPGNTQGRHIREQGKRGCFLVCVDSRGQMQSTPEFLETDTVRWYASTLNVSELDNMDDLIDRLEQKLDDLSQPAEGRPVVARITLEGRGAIHSSLTRSDTASELLERLQALGSDRSPFVWVESLKIRTRALVDIAARREAQDFVGDLLTMINDLRDSPELLVEIHAALSELYQHRKAGKLLNLPDRNAALALLDEAENRCIDLLIEDEN